VAIRFTAGGIRYEADTPQEVVQLQQALKQRASAALGRKSGAIRASRGGHSPASFIFRGRHLAAFELLQKAGDEGVQTEMLVAAIGLPSNKSLPPTIAAWRKRARAIGVNLDDHLVVERKYSGNTPQTTYKLTEEGQRALKADGPEGLDPDVLEAP
jgi:hypothetical protein